MIKKKFKKYLLFYLILLFMSFCLNHFVSADTFSPSTAKTDMVVRFKDGTSDLWQGATLYSTLSYSNSTKSWYPYSLFYELIIPSVTANNTYTTSYTLRLSYDYAWGSADTVYYSYYSFYKNMLNKKYSYGVYYNSNINSQTCNVTNHLSSTYWEQFDFTCIYSFNGSYSNQKIFVGAVGGGLGYVPFGSGVDMDVWNISNTYVTDKNSVIIDQNNTIINQNNETNTKINELNETQKETNTKLDNIDNTLTDSSPISLDTLNNSAGWLPEGPLDSILNLPLSLLNNLSTNLNKQCTPVSLTIPFIDKNNILVLPCLATTLSDNVSNFDTFYNWLGLIVSCLLLYKYLMNLYVWVDNVLMLRLEMYEDFGGKPSNFGSV